MSRRNPTTAAAAAAAAVTLAVALGGCTTAEGPQSAPVPEQADAFYDQDLDPADCSEFAMTPDDELILATSPRQPECGRLQVPVDYATPVGPTARLAVMRFPATGDKLGSVLINPGGPGQAGTSFGAVVNLLLTAEKNPIVERFDIVGFDPRGTGASTPAVDCFTDADRDADPSLALPLTFPAAHHWTPASAAALAERCAEGSGGTKMLEHLGTRAAVEDLDVLREVLGDEKLTYIGGSYGARLGSVYAETYPQRVRAMVLDGTPSPDQDTTERLISQAGGLQDAFEQLASWCAADLPECPFGPDPQRATEELQREIQPLVADPLRTADGRELTFAGASAAVANALFTPATWDDLVAAFGELEAGRPEAMLALRDAFFLRAPDGTYAGFTEANLAWNCNDEARNSPEQERTMRRLIADAAPILDPGVSHPTTSSLSATPGRASRASGVRSPPTSRACRPRWSWR